VFDQASDPMLLVRLDDFAIVDVNPAASRLFGFSLRQFCGLRYANLSPNPVALRQALVRRVTHAGGVEFMNKEGGLFSSDVSYDYLELDQGMAALVVFRGMAAKEGADRRREELETLALEMDRTHGAYFMGEEHERHRLSRELHGHIGPMMVSVKLALEQQLAGGQEAIPRKTVQELLAKQSEAIAELRQATSRLAEGYQYQEDINQAISTLLKKFEEFGDIRTYCRQDPLPETTSKAFRTHLFHIIEEGLANVVRHSDATKISLRLEVTGRQLRMHLLDNGNGCGKDSFTKGMGLRIMKKRADLMGGELGWQSAAGKYFRLDLKAPLG
jgi:signal transduction histidine kinase